MAPFALIPLLGRIFSVKTDKVTVLRKRQIVPYYKEKIVNRNLEPMQMLFPGDVAFGHLRRREIYIAQVAPSHLEIRHLFLKIGDGVGVKNEIDFKNLDKNLQNLT